ncbi:flavin reductase family protein [Kitasatospora kifunensis]|uniref:Flavin reductase (DIM6/NTAB) family NADH-FMN oxidoreductase RutF n=1 Tax=Kitasatospora kifunensis TaxID=58351 RepID=A0A7W7R652_KITKI|nr:flavin reductase family protein [Kitasatospora kifunensis]MBB4926125.1 flavin reductase (DIM6/NTAB) family NADH-FMN oxidoreductase RutF [Kitasatospora kifunensis]
MSTFPSGVAIVTTPDLDGQPWGMTCSSVCSVAVEPPTLLVCLREGSPTLAAMLRSSTFAVNLLHARARAAADLFASGAPHRFDLVRWSADLEAAGPHLTDDAHAIADCRISQTVSVGDHVVVFGEVSRVKHPATADRSPLLYGLRKYASWSAL